MHLKVEYVVGKRNIEEELNMQTYYFNPEVSLLLIDHDDEKVEVFYNHNPYPVQVPKIGLRPPFYFNPRYEQYYPVI